MVKKHAYLILAHNDVPLLQLLVERIDDARNDIFIHWDLKSGEVPAIKTDKAGLYMLDERKSVNWGAFSMVEAEYLLFKRAVQNGHYSYYHLLSGADLPIKSQDYIHSKCEESEGTEFIALADATQDELDYRVQHRFLFSERFKGANLLQRAARKALINLQDWTGYRRTDVKVFKGSQWCSVTQDFVEFLIHREGFVKKLFSRTFCPDEMFVQTVAMNSGFASRIKQAETEFEGNMRYIKWVNGELLPITAEDLPDLERSDRWFARKFSSSDKSLVSLVTQLSR